MHAKSTLKKCIHTRNFSKHTQKMCTKEAHESSSAIPIHVAHTVQSVVNVQYGVRKNGLTLSTLIPVNEYLPYCSLYVSSGADKEILFNNL